MRVLGSLCFAGLVIAVGAGCADPQTECAGRIEHGHIVMLPGVESSAWQLGGVVRGLRDAGIEAEIEIIQWGDRPLASMRNLMDLPKNRARAKEIAGKIEEFRQSHPESPLTLVGYSGGGGMAILIVEALPEGAMLDRLVLVGAAISPKRDLAPVLRRCRHGMVNFYSGLDWFIIGLGTQLFGTIDRVNTWSAGSVGFHDEAGCLKAAKGLVQIPWQKDWVCLGHYGGHIGWLSRAWARAQLAPVIEELRLTTKPSQDHRIAK